MLCLWLKKSRAVFVVMMSLISVSCFVTVGIVSFGDSFYIKALGQLSSFLISASFNLLWLSTTETFPNKIRHVGE